ncbi:probable proliferating cell nuclear antigen [Ustilago bromivora]|uniref:DNA sliding clamp PCNA n=1 Tax=Ustilago bromivora TaxID=307758 RepID=A0A1K0HKK8_9BASI|nr:probable proliferating cell nuclear antigen [Ustilago bromivora]SPC62089.1 probable proliferating cell nuclear antigen [Ustilago sp. UG-2017b]SYW80771.1 probable proliferating cell nuclear antigen [Ustilago bromivora]
MLEARLREAVLLKKVLDAVRELITDANFECSEDGIRLQAMDNSHVALSAIELRSDCFEEFRCDRPMSIGVSLSSLGKILRGANNDDVLSLKKSDDGDTLQMTFESPKSDRVGEFEMKLMDIDSEHLGIPDTQYDAVVKMSSSEFGRICRDLANIGESVKIQVSKEGVSFSAEGEIGAARMTLKQGSGTAVLADDDDDDHDDDVKPAKKKRKADGGSSSSAAQVPVKIEMQQAVNLTFSLKYLSNFAKAAPLADQVELHMSNEVPLLCEFGFENGYVRFYLAPKLSEDDD